MRIRTAVTLIFHKVPVFVQIPGINKYIEKEPRTDQKDVRRITNTVFLPHIKQ